MPDYYGYNLSEFTVAGSDARIASPKQSLAGNPWVWRAVYWDAFPAVDLKLLELGYSVAHIEVDRELGYAEGMRRFDEFYEHIIRKTSLSTKPVLDGLSMGGLYAYSWGHRRPDCVGCIYGDAALCDMSRWPGGPQPISVNEVLAPLAANNVPILHVIGELDEAVDRSENNDLYRDEYLRLGGTFALIVKEGCKHHPHGLSDPTPIIDTILSWTAPGDIAVQARQSALKSGDILTLSPEQWS